MKLLKTSFLFFLSASWGSQPGEEGGTKNLHYFLFYLKVVRVTVWFSVKEVNNMLSSMTLVRLYSLSLSYCVIFIYWCGSRFPKIMLLISLSNPLKAYSWKNYDLSNKMPLGNPAYTWCKDVQRGSGSLPSHPGCKPHNYVLF